MAIITVNAENIEDEHICCAISDKKGENCVASKKAWMTTCFEDGLVFRKLDERGKVFIEYIPADKAWHPIAADGNMHINCFWVSGRFAKQGWGTQLLDQCIEDSKTKGMAGLTIISADKKRSFLADPKYLKKKGFILADTAEPYFTLYYLPFEADAPVPKFRDHAKEGKIEEQGMVLYYTNQCPHAEKYVLLVENLAQERGAAFIAHKIESREEAQKAPTPFTTYSLFHNGQFVTNEILGLKKFEKYLEQWGY